MSKPTGTALKFKTASLKMQLHGETNLNSRFVHIAATFILAAVVGGCGGGGGSSAVNPGIVYPTLSSGIFNDSNGAVASSYSSSPTALTKVAGVTTVFNLSPSPQTITLTVIFPGEPSFSFKVDNPSGLGLLANSPLSSCATCLRFGTVTSDPPDSKTVSFIYLDPASAGLSYSTLGLWSKPSSSGGHHVASAFSFGVETRAQDLPIFGSADYNGFMVGRYADGTNTFAVGANATAHADFHTGPNSSVTFNTTGTRIAQEGIGGGLGSPVLQSGLDLTGTLMSSNGLNLLTGTLTAAGVGGAGTMSGTAIGRYYGPPTGGAAPAEFGGAFFVNNPTQQMNGSFALKKQ